MNPGHRLRLLVKQFPIKLLPANRRLNADRYGFTSLIAGDLDIPFIPRSFCNWIHGWVWWNVEYPEDLGFSKDPKNINKVVNKTSFQRVLLDSGVLNVHVAGLPYSYLYCTPNKPIEMLRIPGSILFIPSHSSESNKVESNIHQYLDFVDEQAGNYAHVSFLVYGLDFPVLAPIIEKRGYLPLLGASPNCSNSLMRVKAMLESHVYVSSNIIGSHILYALSAGSKVSICGPSYRYKIESFLADVEAGHTSAECIERRMHYCDLAFLQNTRYAHLIVEDPSKGTSRSHKLNNFVEEEIGVLRMPSLSQIKNLLGWDTQSQLSGYLYGATRRLSRKLLQ